MYGSALRGRMHILRSLWTKEKDELSVQTVIPERVRAEGETGRSAKTCQRGGIEVANTAGTINSTVNANDVNLRKAIRYCYCGLRIETSLSCSRRGPM